jgi:5-(carboxyamino)imidazole ribonucleotide mutase
MINKVVIMKQPKVGVIMGSDSDLPVMREAADMLDVFGIPHEIRVVSAHRTPDDMAEYGRTAHERGIRVIIAGAGGAAHLPGMIASHSPLPVIGVPIPSKHLAGVDSLYSIVQMPAGVPVASVAIGGGKNAGILAAQILGAQDAEICSKIMEYKRELAAGSREKNSVLVNG